LKTIFFLLLAGRALPLAAQRENARQLLTQNPVVGCWQYIEDARTPSVMFDNDSTHFIWIGCCGAETLVAQGYSTEKKRFTQVSNFVAYSDGKNLYGKIYKSALREKEGTEVAIPFIYKEQKDQLWIRHGGESYKFERINPSTLQPVRLK
jgi:hypothetical protein